MQAEPGEDAVRGLVFDIQRFSIHDGPGIRTTVFLKGCQLKCLWCHNPESQEPYREIIFRKSRCIECNDCIKACNIGAIVVDASAKERCVNRDFCTRCGRCVDVCPSTALQWAGDWMTIDEVMKVVKSDVAFYNKSGGGITLSGGEPLSQMAFSCQVLARCKEEGIHTALETSGAEEAAVIDRIAPCVDLFLYDIKQMDSERHQSYTGVANRLVLQNLERLARAGKEIEIRYPVIPGHNDSEEDVERLSTFIKAVGGIRRIEFLPYHALGETKYGQLGRKYKLVGTKPPSAEYMEQLKRIAREHGIEC